MNKGYLQIFWGEGKGKSSAAIGRGISEAIDGKKVIVIQFLKGKAKKEMGLFARLEPEIKLFRFEKSDLEFDSLTDEMKADEINNIRNGFNFAKKVVLTGECDVLILDEILGLLDENIITLEEFISIVDKAKEDKIQLIITGIYLPELLVPYADKISKIQCQKLMNA